MVVREIPPHETPTAGVTRQFGQCERRLGCSPASVWMRAYSSGVTFVPMDFRPSRDHARTPCSVARNTRCAPSKIWLTNGSRMGTTAHDRRECRTFRVVPIGEPRFLCSTRDGVTS